MGDAVKAWREKLCIPTYEIGGPDRNPMFLEKRVYQGSSGAVYPWPVIDKVGDQPEPREWDAVFLENDYLKVMILPELGGRVQMALDKTNDFHFVYYNQVIKPALVGLAGPWISGGIEFNWPQHHRPNTFGPVDCHVVQHDEATVTVWCNEIDRMNRTRGMHGFRMRAGRAYLEICARLSNRTDLPQTFLWWANPAISVDENHQSIFPPDVNAVMDHGKRDVSEFPIARGTYYKVDYAPGTDISRYKNIPVPTSYMAYRSDFNFVGSYDHGRQAGLLHVCDHHISPGKKQWTWGCGDFGQAWDRHLTDEDGPYIELMCGVFTDNQPDFSWLMPGETRRFSQFFMPYKGVGVVKNATTDAAIGLEVESGQAKVRVYVTSKQDSARLQLWAHDDSICDQTFDASPNVVFETTVELPKGVAEEQLRVQVSSATGAELVAFAPSQVAEHAIPEPAKAIGPPASLPSNESLYLAGVHLEQYRHATRRPEDYYLEALRRDKDDSRCNTALGMLYYRQGRFAQAEVHLQAAIERLTTHNPNPADGEALYGLGLCCVAQGRDAEATEAFAKAMWNAAWQASCSYELACIACRERRWQDALDWVEKCLMRNAEHDKALHLKVCILRQLGQQEQAHASALEVLEKDPLNPAVLYETVLLNDDSARFDACLRQDEHSYLEIALDYARAGDYEDAINLLERLLSLGEHAAWSAMVYYYLAEFCLRAGDDTQANKYLQIAGKHPADYCFPNRLEEIGILESAIKRAPGDARARYYLGNLWYGRRQHDVAIESWEKSVELDASFPTAWRNLCIGYCNANGDSDAAWEAIQKALELDQSDARVLFELDQLAKLRCEPITERLDRLQSYEALVEQRDDLYLEYVTLLNSLGHHQRALELVLARKFHPWEGGEGKVPQQFVYAVTQLALAEIMDDRPSDAIDLLQQTVQWPYSLGEGKLAGIQENNIRYLQGLASKRLGDLEAANAYLAEAAEGLSEPSSPMFYNDQPPDMIYYQGLALAELGQPLDAKTRFEKLVEYGAQHLEDEVQIDFFAVSLPDFLVFDVDLNRRNATHCHYMMALGYAGLGSASEAAKHFERVLQLDPSHQGAIAHGEMLISRLQFNGSENAV